MVRDQSRRILSACGRCCCRKTMCGFTDGRVRVRSFRRFGHGGLRRGEPALVLRDDDALGLDRSILPACYESSEISGKITAAVRSYAWRRGLRWLAAAAIRRPARWATESWKKGSSCTPARRAWSAHMESGATWRPGPHLCHAVRDKWHVMVSRRAPA
jgi:hypothetical protein